VKETNNFVGYMASFTLIFPLENSYPEGIKRYKISR